MSGRRRPREDRLERPGRRTIAWVETGIPDGRPILRLPGTPGSRLLLRPDETPWLERGLRVIMTERPGFGASTGHQRGSFATYADDLVALLDKLRIERLPIIGISGGAPFTLSFAARHPDRVSAASVVVGAAPIAEVEADKLIGLNADSYRLAKAGDIEGMRRLLSQVRKAVLADPLGSFRAAMESAPPLDLEIMSDPKWQDMMVRGFQEALRPGVEGWVDEAMLLVEGWRDLDLATVRASLTWWHGDKDRNAPLSAVRRLLMRLPQARLRVWPNGGHLTPYQREGEILDELLARI